MMGGRGTASGLASTPTASAAAPAPAPAPTPQPTPAPQPQKAARGGLVSDTGIQNMDDAALTALVQRARRAAKATDGRDDTIAQRIADALGITQNLPESVPQEALAQYRSQRGVNGLMYRTVNGARDGSKTARQIAHELTDETGNYGWNYGGGRAFGTGLYFAAQGPGSTPGEAAAHSAQSYGRTNPYTIEARVKPTARIATDADIDGAAGRAWARAHSGALRAMGLSVDSSGRVSSGVSGLRGSDVVTTLAMLRGFDGYRENSSTSVYYTIFNRGALQVAKGNKYDRARRGQLR